MGNLLFPIVLLLAEFFALVIQHFLPAVPIIGARIMLMPIVMFYGAVALPFWGMLLLTFAGGLMWDLLHVQIVENGMGLVSGQAALQCEIGLGWSIIVYAVLGGFMNGFRPWFQRGRWELHCFLSGVCTSAIVLAEYLMISVRRLPVSFYFDRAIWWRIGGAGLVAAFLAPFIFFALSYLGYLVGYDPHPTSVEDR